jgi:long-chain acyl-CoA synthetase
LEDAAAWASWLRTLGLKKGDRVAMLAESRPEWGAAYFGISAAGYVAVPILPDFAEQQVSNIISHAEVKAAIGSSKLTESLDAAVSASESLPKDLPRANLESRRFSPGRVSVRSLRAPGEPRIMFDEPLDPDDIAVILYTSERREPPRAFTLTHNGDCLERQSQPEGGFGRESRECRPPFGAALAHTYECTLGLVGMLSVGVK